ncbi:MAG: nitroreductase/quinone reductase family protein, partial [Chloroflexota bacterium]
MVVVERTQPPQAEHVIKEAAEAPARDLPGSEASTLRRRLDQLEDWLAGYPDTLPVRLVHRAPMLLWRLGLGRIEGDVVLTTRGRKTGLPRHIVIGPTRTDGRRYLWNPYGERAHWYRNLVADPIVTIQDRDSPWTARAVHPADHDEAVALYANLGRDVGRRFHLYLAQLGVEDSPEGFARDIERIHVVRLDPVDGPGPAPQPADLAWIWPVAGVGTIVGTIVARRLRLAVAGTVAVGAALAALRGRELIDRLAELTISRPAGPIGRMLYRDATSMHGEGWRICHQKLALKPQDRLLDVGCGGGTFLSQALQTIESAAGLDHSPDMVELTKASNAQAVAEG